MKASKIKYGRWLLTFDRICNGSVNLKKVALSIGVENLWTAHARVRACTVRAGAYPYMSCLAAWLTDMCGSWQTRLPPLLFFLPYRLHNTPSM